MPNQIVIDNYEQGISTKERKRILGYHRLHPYTSVVE
jgi:hypothetical protein